MIVQFPPKKVDFFDSPVQVQFYYEEDWQLGIGYLDEIIDCETGKVIKVVSVLLENTLDKHPIVLYEDWISLYR